MDISSYIELSLWCFIVFINYLCYNQVNFRVELVLGMAFLGRRKELSLLEGLYDSNRIQVVYLTGDRGVGKTTLVTELLKRRKKSGYFCLRPSTVNVNKAAFYTEMKLQGYGNDIENNWQSCLQDLMRAALGDKRIIVIDRADELEHCFPELLELLIEKINELGDRLRMLLVFVGVELDFLKGRKYVALKKWHPLDLKLEPLRYKEAATILENFTNEEKIMLQGVTGGLPAYLSQIDTERGLKENLYNLFYSENALLRQEPLKLLAEKLRQPHYYHAILCSVACGALRLSEIATTVDMEYNKLSKYMGVLLELGLLKRIIPIDEQSQQKQHKKTFYQVSNPMLQYWYKYVFPYLSIIELGQGGSILRKSVLPKLQDYYRELFAQICLDYCRHLNSIGEFRYDYSYMGWWWQNKDLPTEENRYILGMNGQKAILAKCFWENTKVDLEDIVKLEKLNDILGYEEMDFVVFSRRGFTDGALALSARTPKLRLISLPYMK